jgi:hypothetical protein
MFVKIALIALFVKEVGVKGVRHFMRNFTATAVKEHLRSQVDETCGSPVLTAKEIELVRFIRRGTFDWDALLDERPPSS